MKLLDKDSYEKVIEPLKQVTINNLFARSVVEKHITGKVYVDDTQHPKTFYVVHPYGMSMLFGDSRNREFNRQFREYSLNLHKTREKYEWMQTYPSEWYQVLEELWDGHLVKSAENIPDKETGIIELNTRINFKFNREKYLAVRPRELPEGTRMARTDKAIFTDMKGSVTPGNFWDNADDFIQNGVGFSLFYEGQLATTAYSAFIHDDKLELGIETLPEFRGKGFARRTCAALIDYCLENHFEPLWACKLENTGSYLLAQKLGFEPYIETPYYRLSK